MFSFLNIGNTYKIDDLVQDKELSDPNNIGGEIKNKLIHLLDEYRAMNDEIEQILDGRIK